MVSDAKFSNRLIHETSPYLLQHAHNPVDWYPWGPEALEQAVREDKPIFLSIGYSACHWCHVMAHESFEDEATARLMNELFINVKVDREERPDIDAIYMKALVELTGHGGWPLSIFLTPDQKPFFGGTYFPPSRKYNRPGFSLILNQVHDLYRNQKDEVKTRTTRILNRLSADASEKRTEDLPDAQLIDYAVKVLEERFDSENGGFGHGMKFPEPMSYTLLLRHWQRTGSPTSMEMLDKSLTRMAEGGIHDQLGGGFHRYSTDKEWLVPHFEKMLYDNALLAKLFLEMFQATKQEIYKETAIDTLDYVFSGLTSRDGAFYASQDADTGEGEGHYYAWELKEILNLLGPRHAKIFARAYGATSSGNFERKNVLHIKDSMERISKEEDVAIFEVQHIIKSGKKILLQARGKRERPATDEKIITAWNGLMITAFSRGFTVLRNEKYITAAETCARFLWDRQWDENGLRRICKEGQSKIKGCLEDYAYLLEGFLNLYEASLDFIWVERAEQLAGKMIAEFWDAQNGGFFMTGSSQESLVARLKNPADEAVPSANAIAALSLFTLAQLTGKDEYRKKGEGTLRAFHGLMDKNPAAFAGCLAAVDHYLASPTEIVFAGPKEHAAFKEMQKAVYEDYRPNKIIVWNESNSTQKLLPLAEGRAAVKGEPTVYLCQKQTCHPPVHTGQALMNLLERPPEIRLNLFDEEKHAAEIKAREQNNFLGAMSQIFRHSGLGGKN